MSDRTQRLAHQCCGITRRGFPCGNRALSAGGVCGKCATSRADLERQDVERLEAFLEKVRTAMSQPVRMVSDDNAMTDQSRTPADRLAQFAARNPRLAKTAKSASDMVNSDVATSTEVTYQQAFAPFERYCSTGGFASMPAEPEAVVLYLQEMSQRLGPTGGPLKHPTLEKTVHAISFTHRREGYADPTKDSIVRRWLEGHARTHPANPAPKCPLLIADVEAISRAAAAAVTGSLRDAAIVMAATQPGTDITAARLASLQRPDQVEILDEGASALLWVTCGTSRRERVPVQILAEDDPRICPVRALSALLAAHVDGRPLLANEVDGRQLTRQGVRKILRRLTAQLHEPTPVGSVLKLSTNARLTVAELIYGAEAATLRDLALIPNQYWAARRGAEIAAMRMGNVEFTEEGVLWHIGRTKTDQFGKGTTVGVPADAESPACPARALAAWLARYRLLLGRELRSDDPVFPRLDRAGYLAAPVSRAAIASIIQRRASAAGLTGDYGAHSPRSGFVTDAINCDVPAVKIALHGGWTSVDSLDTYYRRTGTFGVTNPAVDVQQRRRRPKTAPATDGVDDAEAS